MFQKNLKKRPKKFYLINFKSMVQKISRKKILTEVSIRHVHLAEKDFKKLFGDNYKLHPLKDLSQPGQFAAKETVDLINKGREIKNVRILGPLRKETQVELALTDAYHLKINPPLRMSGDLEGTPGIKIRGPKGTITLKKGVIIAKRHLHISIEQAKKLKLKNGQKIKIKIPGERNLTFGEIIVRVSDKYDLAFHIDSDEGNAAGINGKTYGEIV